MESIHTSLVLFQLKRLKLRKNNWDSDTYEFDEVLTEFASQKRVYEVVARPVVEVGIAWYICPRIRLIIRIFFCEEKWLCMNYWFGISRLQ